MTSKIKMVALMWGLSMEGGLAFHYDRHEEITRCIQMRDIYYHPMVKHVFCSSLKVLADFVVPNAMIRVQFNT